MCTCPSPVLPVPCRATGATPHRAPPRPLRHAASHGLTLVELVVAIAIAGVVMTSIWKAWGLLGRASADPLVARQSLAIAQSLMREIELQPLPGSGVAGSTPGRTGYASMADYNGLTMTGIQDAEGNAITGLEAYRAAISVTAAGIGGLAANTGWWVSVDVTGPGGEHLVLGQWRAQR